MRLFHGSNVLLCASCVVTLTERTNMAFTGGHQVTAIKAWTATAKEVCNTTPHALHGCLHNTAPVFKLSADAQCSNTTDVMSVMSMPL